MEETMTRIQKLEGSLTGALTTMRKIQVTRPADEPAPPSWWRGDEDASASALVAMSQMSRR